jgi:hypothetical protein
MCLCLVKESNLVAFSCEPRKHSWNVTIGLYGISATGNSYARKGKGLAVTTSQGRSYVRTVTLRQLLLRSYLVLGAELLIPYHGHNLCVVFPTDLAKG